MFYHKACLNTYIKKYERLDGEQQHRKGSKKRELFEHELVWIQDLIDRDIGFHLSDARDAVNDGCGEDVMSNKEVKIFIADHFGENVQFCKSERQYESMLVFSSNLTVEEVVKKLRSINENKDTAMTIRNALKEVSFNLADKFCDAEELKRSWESIKLPECLITLFAKLFNIPQSTICGPQLNNEEAAFDTEDEDCTDNSNGESVRGGHLGKKSDQNNVNLSNYVLRDA